MKDSENIGNKAGYDPEFYEPLTKIEEKHFWFYSRNQVICKLTKKITDHKSEEINILEIGCGTGNVLRILENEYGPKNTYGMDLFHEGLLYAQKRVHSSLIQADMAYPPFKPVFSIIGMFDALEHFEDDVKVLSLLKDSLADDGYLILGLPAFQSLWSYFDEAGAHYRRYRIRDTEAKLTQAGYEVEMSSYYMAILFPILWIWRKLAALTKIGISGKETFDHELAVNELRIIPILNGILKNMLLFENFLITSLNLSLPFGTSLYVVAKKKK